MWWQEESWPLQENGQARTVRQLPLNAHLVRWLLATYRVDPAVVEASLPAPLRPRLIGGWGVATVSFVALGQPRVQDGVELAATSENASHGFAVEWDDVDGTHAGIYVARRDTDSLLNSLAGGRYFPGEQHPAGFHVTERSNVLRAHVASHDKELDVGLTLERGLPFQPSTLFASLEDAIYFFETGPADYTVTRDPLRLDGVAITADLSELEPLRVAEATSTYFEDEARFPACSAYIDSAFLMRNVSADWRALPSLRVAPRVLSSAIAG